VTTWPELEQQFRALNPAARTLRLDRTWGTGTVERWFTICEDGLARQRFEALATLAAQLLKSSGGPDLGDEFAPASDLLTLWYQAVWKLVGPSETPMFGEAWEDGKARGSVFSGRIYKLAEASAVAALRLQAIFPPPPAPTAAGPSFWDKWAVPIIGGLIVTIVGGVVVWLLTR
jgi:hypothetical protein